MEALYMKFGITPRDAQTLLRQLQDRVSVGLQEHGEEVEQQVRRVFSHLSECHQEEWIVETIIIDTVSHRRLQSHLLASRPSTL